MPYPVLVSARSVLSSGKRGTKLAKIAPLVKNIAATAIRARRAEESKTAPATTALTIRK